MATRRDLLKGLILAAVAPPGWAARGESPFGNPVRDPDGMLDLPATFRYRIVACEGDEMSDGLLVPARADGMAAFDAGDGRVALVCNHENHPSLGSAFGPANERLGRLPPDRLYDAGGGVTPGAGGTTTILYDLRAGETLSCHLSLAGTEINCAGGPTPWGSWLSCEECFTDPGESWENGVTVKREQRHGYVFEVPAGATAAVEPVPLVALGRFEHEAAAVDAATGIVYLSEDRHEGLLYRFVPDVPGRLREGGRLQALALVDRPSFDTRNWRPPGAMPERQWFPACWVDLEDPDPDENDLRLQGAEAGAACFARGEGLTFADGSLFMTATIGGPAGLGQIFEYRPAGDAAAQSGSGTAGQLRLLAESRAGSVLRHADNLIMAPWGDLVVCEDTVRNCGLVGLKADGSEYRIAANPYTDSELAGVCFSPDGGTMFVNIQDRGITLAITGPWTA